MILALHPGTRAALERAGIPCRPDVAVVEPQGYRTTLALQLHAAAVLTDSGGVQREAAWLGVPCLVLREHDRVGRGRRRIRRADGRRRASTGSGPRPSWRGSHPRRRRAGCARDRAAAAWTCGPAGAAEAIVAALEQRPVSRRPEPGRRLSRVVMFVFNDCRTDSRVLREAGSLPRRATR